MSNDSRDFKNKTNKSNSQKQDNRKSNVNRNKVNDNSKANNTIKRQTTQPTSDNTVQKNTLNKARSVFGANSYKDEDNNNYNENQSYLNENTNNNTNDNVNDDNQADEDYSPETNNQQEDQKQDNSNTNNRQLNKENKKNNIGNKKDKQGKENNTNKLNKSNLKNENGSTNPFNKSKDLTNGGSELGKNTGKGLGKDLGNDLGKGLGKDLGKGAGKGASKVAEQGAKQGAKEGAKATGKATAAASTAGKGAGVAASGGCLSTLVPFLAIMIAFVLVLSAVLSIFCGTVQTDDDVLTSEAQEIMYIFNSFAYTSNDDERAKYQTQLEEIKKNGYSSTLCALWKGLAVDFYLTPISETDFYAEQYDKSAYDSSYECVFEDYCGRYYLERNKNVVEENRHTYLQKTFDDCGYDKDDYVGKVTHYHYINNILKMCLDAFTDTDNNKVYESPSTVLKKFKQNHKDDIKGLSSDEILELCREYQIRKIAKNLQGKEGLANKCIVYEGKDENGKKQTISFVRYLYNDKEYYYNRTDFTFKKGIFDTIVNYDYIFRNGGDSTDICELAKGELGKQGKDYCYGQTKAWGNSGLNEWCAIFQAYLLEQSGIEPSDVGWSASCSAWISGATSKGLYHSRSSGYKPRAGDILFFTWGHVGIIYSVDGSKLVTIEGNTDGSSASTTVVGQHDSYTTNSSVIKGYLSMSSFYSTSSDGDGVIEGAVIDSSYTGHKIKLTTSERNKIEALVTNENSANGYTGCLLLAQCMRDAIYSGKAKAATIKSDMGYSASDSGTACDNAKKAVKKIFDEGGYAVKHRILYMYNPSLCTSSWHESQLFVCEHGSGKNKIRYFDAKSG